VRCGEREHATAPALTHIGVKFNRPRSSRAHSLRQKMNKNGAAWRKVDARALIASSQKRVLLSWCVSNEREHLINGACFLKVKNNKKIARARGEKFTLLNQKKCDQMKKVYVDF
jgi:hypothetical protein